MTRVANWLGVVVVVALVAAAFDPVSGVLVAALAVLVGGSRLSGRGWVVFGRRPRGVPDPPAVVHEPDCPSGVYRFDLWSVGRQSRHVCTKVGKAKDLQYRISGYVTLEDRLIVGEQVLRTPRFHELEQRIHDDLRPWRLNLHEDSRQRARELYEPESREVRWYLDELWRRSGAA